MMYLEKARSRLNNEHKLARVMLVLLPLVDAGIRPLHGQSIGIKGKGDNKDLNAKARNQITEFKKSINGLTPDIHRLSIHRNHNSLWLEVTIMVKVEVGVDYPSANIFLGSGCSPEDTFDYQFDLHDEIMYWTRVLGTTPEVLDKLRAERSRIENQLKKLTDGIPHNLRELVI